MSTPILIFACITALLLIFELSRIVTALVNIRIINRNLARLFEIKRKNNPPKQREYWRDQNGFKHWRKKVA